jgi:hypothetical protein
MWYQFNTDLSTPNYQHRFVNTELSTPICQHRIINTDLSTPNYQHRFINTEDWHMYECMILLRQHLKLNQTPIQQHQAINNIYSIIITTPQQHQHTTTIGNTNQCIIKIIRLQLITHNSRKQKLVSPSSPTSIQIELI